jgi:hypothetical protein
MSDAATYARSFRPLTAKKLRAIDCLVLGKNDRETAEAVGVNPKTVTRWRLYDPYFMSALRRKCAQIFNPSIQRLRSLIPKAIEVLEIKLSPRSEDCMKAIALLLQLTKSGGLLDPKRNCREPEDYIDRAEYEEELDLLNPHDESMEADREYPLPVAEQPDHRSPILPQPELKMDDEQPTAHHVASETPSVELTPQDTTVEPAGNDGTEGDEQRVNEQKPVGECETTKNVETNTLDERRKNSKQSEAGRKVNKEDRTHIGGAQTIDSDQNNWKSIAPENVIAEVGNRLDELTLPQLMKVFTTATDALIRTG